MVCRVAESRNLARWPDALSDTINNSRRFQCKFSEETTASVSMAGLLLNLGINMPLEGKDSERKASNSN